MKRRRGRAGPPVPAGSTDQNPDWGIETRFALALLWLAARGSTDQNPDWGIETAKALRSAAIRVAQPTRIPTGGLKQMLGQRVRSEHCRSTDQNPDWGIETISACCSRRCISCSTDQNPDWGIETATCSHPIDSGRGLTDQNPDWGIETSSLARASIALSCCSTDQNPDWGIETRNWTVHLRGKCRLNRPESRLGD